MNERVIALAQQVTGQYVDLPGVCPDSMDKDELVRFAELIVRECAIIARSTKREIGVDDGAVIRKHFGVE